MPMPADLSFTEYLTFFMTLTPVLGVFFAWAAAFFLGETGIILVLVGTLSQGTVLPLMLISVYAGSFLSDLFWYGVARTPLGYTMRTHASLKRMTRLAVTYAPILTFAERRPYTVLLMSKFLVGFRLVFTLYIAQRKDISFLAYVCGNLVANVFFIGALYALVQSMGTGIEKIFGTGEINPFRLLSLAVVCIIIVQFGMRFFERHIMLLRLKK